MKAYLMSISSLLVFMMTIGCQSSVKKESPSLDQELVQLRHQIVVEQFKAEQAQASLQEARLEKEVIKQQELMMLKVAEFVPVDQSNFRTEDTSRPVVASSVNSVTASDEQQGELIEDIQPVAQPVLISLEKHWEELPAISPEENHETLTHTKTVEREEKLREQAEKLTKQMEDLRKARESMAKAQAMFRELDALRHQDSDTRYAQK